MISYGLKNEFEAAVVNEPPVFELLKFYCISESKVNGSRVDIEMKIGSVSKQYSVISENTLISRNRELTENMFILLNDFLHCISKVKFLRVSTKQILHLRLMILRSWKTVVTFTCLSLFPIAANTLRNDVLFHKRNLSFT